MRSFLRGTRLRAGAALLAAAALGSAPDSGGARRPIADRATLSAPLSAAGAPAEVRALWVQRGTLTSAPAITELVERAAGAGFNTLIVQVRGRGDAFFASRLEPRGAPLARTDRSFDPLALVLAAAHHAGLAVHAWVNVDLVSDAEPPASRSHVARLHPEWLMAPRDLVGSVEWSHPRSPAYLAALSRYAREHSSTIEGLYLSPLQPPAADYTVRVVADIAKRYPVDGVHLDYARYPNDAFDYSERALREFEEDVLESVPAADRRDYGRRARRRPLFYTEMFPQRWAEFRRARLTAMVVRIRAAVKAHRPAALLSAAVWPDPEDAGGRRFQDWRGWLTARLLDAVCPMAYTVDPERFRAQVALVKQIAGARPVWAGIGAFQLAPAAAVENIKTARRVGADGIALFSYDNIRPGAAAPGGERDYLAAIARGAFDR